MYVHPKKGLINTIWPIAAFIYSKEQDVKVIYQSTKVYGGNFSGRTTRRTSSGKSSAALGNIARYVQVIVASAQPATSPMSANKMFV